MGNYPLQEKHIIVTNSSGSRKLNRLLEQKRAKVTEFPMIEISAKRLNATEKSNIKQLNSYDFIFFTSKNGVKFFFEYLKKNNYPGLKSDVKFYLIGKATAKKLENYGYKAHFINPGNTAEEFIPFLEKRNELTGKKVLLVLGNLAPDTLHQFLNKRCETQRVDVYKTDLPERIDQKIFQLIYENKYDLITFTSPSAIDNLLKMSPEVIRPENMKAACIGKRTETALEAKGYKPVVTASKAKMEVLVNEIENYYSHNYKK